MFMINREAKNEIENLAGQFPVVGITGPRQSGKTTLAKLIFPQKKYVTFDDISVREVAKNNPIDFVRAFPDGVIIDEVQKVPEIFDTIKLFVDSGEYSPGKYILTGSSQFRLRKGMSESLSGRAAYFNLLPFTISEVLSSEKSGDSVYDIILRGQYPPLYDKSKKYKPKNWFEGYIDTYLDMDVKNEINVSNLLEFKKFIKICALNSGGILSYDSVARHLSVSAPTIKQWISILEKSYIIHLLPPVSENEGKTLVKSPKIYFLDSGLLCHLLGISNESELLLSEHKGHIIETFAISEVLKRRYNQGEKDGVFFYRDKNKVEVDLVIEGKKNQAIEIKSDPSPNPKHTKQLNKFVSDIPDIEYNKYVFYLGDLDIKLDDVQFVPWNEWDRMVKI